MRKASVASMVVLVAALMLPALTRAQTAQPAAPVALDGWGRPVVSPVTGPKPAPAPRRDLSGIWEPANGPGDGIGGTGSKAMPEDGKPEHQLPYTPLGLATLALHKPGNGARMVHPSEINDPEVVSCDPQGLPRENLYELRTTQILQTPLSVVILYEFDKIWRVIWADGRSSKKSTRNPGGSVTPWVNGRMITRLSCRRTAPMREPGSIKPVVHIAKILS